MPSVNKQVMAAQYGFAYSVLKSNKELSRVFDKAVKETWTPDRFLAAVRNTKWYKRTSESARNAEVQKKSDPATYKSNVRQVGARIDVMANEFGARLTGGQQEKLADTAYRLGWDDNQLRKHLDDYVKRSPQGILEGQAGEWERQWRQHASSMGVAISNKTLKNWAKASVGGNMAPEDAIGRINEWAKSKYPHLAQRIQGGETVRDIAEPYRQTAAELLEMDPERFSLHGELMQKALNARTSKGKPTTLSTYAFEDIVRKDWHWKHTDNAKKSADAVAQDFLQQFGLIS